MGARSKYLPNRKTPGGIEQDGGLHNASPSIGTVRFAVNRDKEYVGSEVHGKFNPVDVPRGVDLPTLRLPINWQAHRTHRVFLKLDMKPLELEP